MSKQRKENLKTTSLLKKSKEEMELFPISKMLTLKPLITVELSHIQAMKSTEASTSIYIEFHRWSFGRASLAFSSNREIYSVPVQPRYSFFNVFLARMHLKLSSDHFLNAGRRSNIRVYGLRPLCSLENRISNISNHWLHNCRSTSFGFYNEYVLFMDNMKSLWKPLHAY